MTVAVIFGPNSGRHDMADMRGLAGRHPRVAGAYERAAEVAGIPADVLLHERERPADLEPTRLNGVALAAGMIGVADTLADAGLAPDVAGGISLGESVAAGVTGGIAERDLIAALAGADVGPADPGRAEGIGFVFVPRGVDAAPYEEHVAVDYGPVRRGRGRLIMVSGRREDLRRLEEEGPLPIDVAEAPYSTTAHHTPLREHARARLERHLDAVPQADPQVPVCTGLDGGRTVTTAEGVRDLLLRNEVEPLSVPGMLREVTAHEPTAAIAVGPFLRKVGFDVPYPVAYVDGPDELDRALETVGKG
ncbi:hypothetical protein [Actinomadura macrotermitis]|uniref:ACP S-malonyltransferase n=1 Tax=Actinomadura macrotermitis TaxID=2585200 RepID=A0A7K0BZ44_9ACTN|nr:hypothetical protein [Actinomadura macrotermitis]MQY06440.1 hypothetical protein [Actinomadura macrotermitis]